VHRAGIIFPATSIISGPTLSVRQLDGPTSARIAVLGLDIPQILDDLDLQYRRRSDLLATTRAAVEQLAGMGELDGCRGPAQRWLASRALRGKSPQQVAGFIRGHMPKDARAQQEKVASADGLAVIAPVHFCNFPAILHGWIERVFTYGFAYGLTEAAWHGDVTGRRPLLHHKRALIMTSTLFDEAAYAAGIRDAMEKVIDEWTFRYPGIENVEHVYFYAAAAAPAETIQRYLEQAYALGCDFDKAEVTSIGSQPS